MKTPRCSFIKTTAMGVAAITFGGGLPHFAATSYGQIDGANSAEIQITQSMRRAFDWQIVNRTTDTGQDSTKSNTAPRGWVAGAFLTGVMEAWRTTGDTAYLDHAWKRAEENAWKPGASPTHADDHIVPQTYIELYEIDPKRADLKPTIELFDRLLAQKHKGAELFWWCDSLYMQPPTWARLAKVTTDSRYLDEMTRLYWEAVDFLYDPQERLFFRDKKYMPHDKDFQPSKTDIKGKQAFFQERNDKKMFWSRGNAWVFAGLARIMDYMPAGDQRARFETLFKTMAVRILELQSPDGLWRMGLLDPAAYGHGEESGSAFFVYGLAWGVRNGLLNPQTTLPPIENGWRALQTCQCPNGMVGYVQPIAAAPGKHSAKTSQEYGTGAFLLAGSEMIKLLRLRPPVPMPQI
jgi:rhamnogalacturonyl hydrolase YesR